MILSRRDRSVGFFIYLAYGAKQLFSSPGESRICWVTDV